MQFYLSQASGKWVCLNTEIIIIFSLNTMFFLSFLTAVRTAMPDFHRKMQDKLRTPEEGADTMIWLAIAKDALNKPSGMFFQGKSI